MSECVQIKVRNTPNYLQCDNYEISVNRDGQEATFEYITCSGVTFYITIRGGFRDDVCVQQGSVPFKVNGDASVNEIELRGDCTDIGPPIDEPTYLDLFPGFQLRSTKQLTELTEIDKLKFDYSLGFSVPHTEHNFRILKTYMNPNVMDNDYTELEVEVITGSHIVTQSQLYVVKSDERSIEVKLRLSVEHWARAAKDLKLCDLEYHEIQMDFPDIEDVIENQWPYDVANPNGFQDPNNLGIWFPAAHYGTLLYDPTNVRANDHMIPLEYWRPWFYVTGVLQRGFCKLGWQFESPLFHSELGSKLITYLFDKQFGLSGSVNLQRKTLLNASADVLHEYKMPSFVNRNITVIRFPNIKSDAGNSFIDFNKYYSAGGVVDVKGLIKFHWDEEPCTLRLAKVGIDYTNIIQVYDEITISESKESQEWEFQADGISMTRQTKLCVLLTRAVDKENFYVEIGSHIEIVGVRPYFIRYEYYKLNELIDCDYTFLAFLKGLAREFNIKFTTNFSTRTVELYQAYKNDFWGDIIEGFLIEETVQDISERVNVDSYKATTPNIDQPRYIRLAYKDSSLSYTDDLELKEPLWSKLIDLGEKYTINETLEQANDFFTAFLNSRGISFGSHFVHVPRLQVGDEEYSFDQEPTIAIAHGNVIQQVDVGLNPKLRYFTWTAVKTELIPYAYQYSGILAGIIHNDIVSPVETPAMNLIYEVNKEVSEYNIQKSLYDVVYKRWFLNALNNLRLEYLVHFTNKEFLEISFRGLVSFYHLGRLVTCRGEKINDYHFCSDIYTPYTLVPERKPSDLCGLIPDGGDDPEEDLCRNNPVLLVSGPFNGCYTFTIGGVSNSPIDAVLFEYSYTTSPSWVALPNITNISTQFCDPVGDFEIRATVSYTPVGEVACPDITTIPKLIEPCIPVSPEVDCVLVQVPVGRGGYITGVRLKITLPHSDNVDVNFSQYSLDSGPWQNIPALQSGHTIWTDAVTGGTNVDFEVRLQYAGCEEILILHSCEIPQGSPIPCSQTEISLECVQESPGCFSFNRLGVLPLDINDEIKYRCSEDDGATWTVWKVWDQETDVCCTLVQAQWFVHFCDDVCPFTCTPIIECGACEPFELGTYSPQAVCNSGDI